MRGDVYRFKPGKSTMSHEQSGPRYAIIVQASGLLPLSTWVVVPTSGSARPMSCRVAVTVNGSPCLAMAEQVRAIDPQRRLGDFVGHLSLAEMQSIDEALRLILDLD